jgi:hypothetical protein
MALTDYDFALAVNLDVINRIVKLSYDRGYLDQVSAGKDSSGNSEYVKVVDGPPVFTPGPDGHGRLHLTIAMNRASGSPWPWEISQNWDAAKQWWALKNPFRVALDLDVYLRASSDAPDAFEIVLDHIDTSTSHIVADDIDHSSSSVAAALKADLEQRNPGLAGTVISDPEKLPPSLFNLPFSALRFEVDANGYFVFYMAYGDRYR